MELKSYDIVKKIVMTEKSASLFNKLGHITLEVEKSANKLMVKRAVEEIWDVKVQAVRVITKPGKNKRFGKYAFTNSSKKKAIIVLKEGYKIELPNQFDGVTSQANALSGKEI